MKVLAVETSTLAGSVALVDEEGIIGEGIIFRKGGSGRSVVVVGQIVES